MNKDQSAFTKYLMVVIIAAIMLLASIIGAQAYSYVYGYDYYPVTYNYYNYDGYNNNNYGVPTIAGPFPRGYIWNSEFGDYYGAAGSIEYRHDDFNGYDSFIGYKDLDVFTSQGVEVYRNPYGTQLDVSYIPEEMRSNSLHVYGYMPGPGGTCLLYRKHYHHEHPWELEGYYSYGYYSPMLAYQKAAPTCPSCQQRSICELTHGCV